MTFGRNIVI